MRHAPPHRTAPDRTGPHGTAPDRTYGHTPTPDCYFCTAVCDEDATHRKLVIPGLGHLVLGRRRAAALFFAPVALLVLGLVALFIQGGFTAILAWIVTPGVLPLLAVINIGLAIWRLAAMFDATRTTPRPGLAFAVLVPAAFVLVLVPQTWLGTTIAATDDFLNSTFASGPEESEQPDDTPPPRWTYAPDVEVTPEPSEPTAPTSPDPPTVAPTPTHTPPPTDTPPPATEPPPTETPTPT